MKLYNDSIKDLRLAKAMRIQQIYGRPKDKLVNYLIEQHHKLCEEEITDDQFRQNVKLILR